MATPKLFFKKPVAINAAVRRYAPGLGYYNERNAQAMAAAKKARVNARAAAAAANPLGSILTSLRAQIQSPAQQEAAARRAVDYQIAAEQRALNLASQDARDEAYRQAQAAEGFNKALLGFAASDRAAIEAAYGTQSGALSSLGASLGGAMTGSEDAALAASQA